MPLFWPVEIWTFERSSWCRRTCGLHRPWAIGVGAIHFRRTMETRKGSNDLRPRPWCILEVAYAETVSQWPSKIGNSDGAPKKLRVTGALLTPAAHLPKRHPHGERWRTLPMIIQSSKCPWDAWAIPCFLRPTDPCPLQSGSFRIGSRQGQLTSSWLEGSGPFAVLKKRSHQAAGCCSPLSPLPGSIVWRPFAAILMWFFSVREA